jgi:hypothetical protein
MKVRAKWILGISAVMALDSGAWLAYPADEPPRIDDGIRAFMRTKLDASSKILEGLATEDFHLISDGAEIGM